MTVKWKPCWKRVEAQYAEVKKGDAYDQDGVLIIVPNDDYVLLRDAYGVRLVHKTVFDFNYITGD